jgi:Fe-S cluster biogenesis protein NfuA
MIPLHPQAIPGCADELRWVLPLGLLGFTGLVGEVPEPVRGLLADGTLCLVRAEPRAVVTRLGAGRSWSVEGARVRSALHAALGDAGSWRPDDDSEPAEDVRLTNAVEALIAGPVGDFTRSHGGWIELVSVRDGVVEVRLEGACHGCPAAAVTLRAQLERRLRESCPWLREVREAGRTHHLAGSA